MLGVMVAGFFGLLLFVLTRPAPPKPVVWVEREVHLMPLLSEATYRGPGELEPLGLAPTDGDRRTALLLLPGSELTFGTLDLPSGSTFRCAIGVPPGQRDPARFALYHVPDVGPPRMLHSRLLSARQQGWIVAEVPLELPPGSARLLLEAKREEGGSCFIANPTITAMVPSHLAAPPPVRKSRTVIDLIERFKKDAVIRSENPLKPLRIAPLSQTLQPLLGSEPTDLWLSAVPDSAFETRLFVPESGFLEVQAFHAPLQKVTWRRGPKPSIDFDITIDGQPAWSRTLMEEDVAGASCVIDETIDLRRWAGQGIQMVFRTTRKMDETANVPFLTGWTRLRVGERISVERRMEGPGRPNVLVVAVDSLRTDRVGAFGSDRELTPNLDHFAAKSRIYDAAISPAPLTVAATGSMLTGLWPHQLGLTGLGKRSRLDDEAVTLAEVLAVGGIRSGAFVARGTHVSERGFEQGFSTWVPYTDPPRLTVPKVTADELFTGFLDWADSRPGEQFFSWVQCVDVAAPYSFDPDDADKGGLLRPNALPPNRDRVLAWQKTDRGLRERHLSCDCERNEQGELVLTEKLKRFEAELESNYCPSEAHRLALIERYDTGVMAWDRAFGNFLSELEKRPYGSNTIVIVVGTHGEELFDHQRLGSGQSVHEESIHVPLLVSGPGVEPKRIADVVSTGGLFSSVIRMTSLRIDDARFIPAWPTQSGQSARPIAFSLQGRLDPSRTDAVAIRTKDWKLIRTEEPPVEKLFQIAKDPNETTDLSAQAGSIYDNLQAELDRWLSLRKPSPATAKAAPGE